MHQKVSLLAVIVLAMMASTAQARDTRHQYPLEDALTTEGAQERLDPDIALYFGDQKHGEVVTRYGEFQSNKKTNAFNKTDKTACEWAFLSAMLSLQKRARREGGNAVINIRSYYKRKNFVSDTEYECGAGAIMAGVTFKGDVVKLK